MLTKAPRGTRDVVPGDVYKWHYVEDAIRSVCRAFGYREIRVPVFEHTELYERGVGDTTDVVQKEMYTFLDKGGRSITLRPEGTSGVVRAFIENHLYAEALPAKLFYILSCYRYEKPQAGRLREFHQFGVETFGAASPQTDVEVIALAMELLRRLKLPDLRLSINSVGCRECRPLYNQKLKAYFERYRDRLCGTCQDRLEKNPMRIIDCKVDSCKRIAEGAPMLLDEQCEGCRAHFEQVKDNLAAVEIPYVIDKTIVRGLDYYTTTVFEIRSEDFVVCGGGRYDDLVEEIGGPKTPGVGFGLGLERLLLTLEARGLFPENPDAPRLYIVSVGERAQKEALALAGRLRQSSISVQSDLMNRSVKAQMKYADKIGAAYVLVLGDSELDSGIARLKNMADASQLEVSLDGIAQALPAE